MSDLVIELSEQAQTLCPADRARLAELLLDSIHVRASHGIEAAWDAELLRRIDDMDRGDAKLVAAEEAFGQVRRALQ